MGDQTGVKVTANNTMAIMGGSVGIGTTAPSGPLSVTPVQYSTGTASQSTTTVTGSGTTWTSAMVGSQFVFTNGVSAGTITAFGSATSLTVSTSQTVTSQAYKIGYTGLQVASAGNVGIGITPTNKLDIYDATAQVVAKLTSNTRFLAPALVLEGNPQAGNETIGQIAWSWAGSSPAGISALRDPAAGGSNDGALAFSTKGSERVRIDMNGNVGIGNTPSYPLDVTGVIRSTSSVRGVNFVFEGDGAKMGMGSGYATFLESGSSALRIKVGGLVVTNSYTDSAPTNGAYIVGSVGIGVSSPTEKLDVAGNIKTSGCLYYASSSLGTCASDERIKKDVHAFDLGLTALLGMKPVKFKYNGLAGFAADGQEQLGVIAQDIELTAPELVKRQLVQLRKDDREKTEIKVVDYGAFIYVVINAIKELSDKWSKESAEIQQLKAENAQIKAYLCQTTPAAPFCK